MRTIAEIPRPDCRITIFHWNNRYIIKLEAGFLEQTFKVDQFHFSNEEEVTRLVSDGFIAQALQRFEEMNGSLQQAMKSL